jgi:hypothetical protein
MTCPIKNENPPVTEAGSGRILLWSKGPGIAQNPDASQSRARLRYLARWLHALGPRPLFHFLDEIERGAPLRPHLERYVRLPRDFIKAYGGDEFDPPRRRCAMSAFAVSSALRGKRRGKGLCRCPVPSHGQGYGDRHPSLSVADGPEGKLLVHCHSGCDPRAVLAVLHDRGLDGDHDRAAGPAGRREVFREPVRTIEPEPDARALDLWNKAAPASGTLVEKYLRYRGITIPIPPTLRFIYNLAHNSIITTRR